MPARAHLDLDAVVNQEVPVTEDIVDRFDLEVHVTQAGPVGAEHRELVVHWVNPDQAGRVLDPVRDSGIEVRTPEPVRLVYIWCIQAQMAELGDPSRPGERDRPHDRLLVADELEPVAKRVVEADQGADAPRPSRRRATPPDSD